MNLRIKQSLPLIPGALPLKSGGAPEMRGTRFPHIANGRGLNSFHHEKELQRDGNMADFGKMSEGSLN